jgi:hypothetical protein
MNRVPFSAFSMWWRTSTGSLAYISRRHDLAGDGEVELEREHIACHHDVGVVRPVTGRRRQLS